MNNTLRLQKLDLMWRVANLRSSTTNLLLSGILKAVTANTVAEKHTVADSILTSVRKNEEKLRDTEAQINKIMELEKMTIVKSSEGEGHLHPEED